MAGISLEKEFNNFDEEFNNLDYGIIVKEIEMEDDKIEYIVTAEGNYNTLADIVQYLELKDCEILSVDIAELNKVKADILKLSQFISDLKSKKGM